MPLYITFPLEGYEKDAEIVLALSFENEPSLGKMGDMIGNVEVDDYSYIEDAMIATEMGFNPPEYMNVINEWEKPARFLTRENNLVSFLHAIDNQGIKALHPNLELRHLQDLFSESVKNIIDDDFIDISDVYGFFRILNAIYPRHNMIHDDIEPDSKFYGFYWPTRSIKDMVFTAINGEDTDAFLSIQAQCKANYKLYELDVSKHNCKKRDYGTDVFCEIYVDFLIMGERFDSWIACGSARFIDAELQDWVVEEDDYNQTPTNEIDVFLEVMGESFKTEDIIEDIYPENNADVPEPDYDGDHAVFIGDDFYGRYYDLEDAKRFAMMSNATSNREGLHTHTNVYRIKGIDDEESDEEYFYEDDINNWEEVW